MHALLRTYLNKAVDRGATTRSIEVSDLKADGTEDVTKAFTGHPSDFYKLVVTAFQPNGDLTVLPANSKAALKTAVASPATMFEFLQALRAIAGL